MAHILGLATLASYVPLTAWLTRAMWIARTPIDAAVHALRVPKLDTFPNYFTDDDIGGLY